jgi:hypothetical protein
VAAAEAAMTDHTPTTEERGRQITRELGELGYSREQIDAIPTEEEARRIIKDRTPPRKTNGANGHTAEAPASTRPPPKDDDAPQDYRPDSYDLNDISIELRKALNRVTASLVVAKRDSVKVLKAVRAGVAALAEFDNDPGYDIAIAHLQAVARDHYTLSINDIQVQISAGIQDALERRARPGQEAAPA